MSSAPPARSPDAPLSGAMLFLAAIVLASANFIAVLDMTIANVSVPTISGSLGISSSQGTWIITSYSVAEAIIDQTERSGMVDLPALLEGIAAAEERNRLTRLFIDDGHLAEIDAKKAYEECRASCERRLLKAMDMKELRRELAQLDSDS